MGPSPSWCRRIIFIDQTYALSHIDLQEPPLSDKERSQYYLGAAFPLWLTWQGFAAVGIVFGQVNPVGKD